MSEIARRIALNLQNVRRRIAQACLRSNRPDDAARLVAVTKTVEPDLVRMLFDAGQRDFGENRPQELQRKFETLVDLDLRWHMIGHLQSNKVRKTLSASRFIHSVDSLKLAREISRIAAQDDLRVEILLEVNVSGEDAKSGLSPGETSSVAGEVGKLPNVQLAGLMTMAPLSGNPEDARGVFVGLRELADKIRAMNLPGVRMDELSMGMSNDFEVAVEEGATIVRVGSALFEGVS